LKWTRRHQYVKKKRQEGESEPLRKEREAVFAYETLWLFVLVQPFVAL
jgi:hypothetical protein